MKAKLQKLSTALTTGNIVEAGAIYREIENHAAWVVSPPMASKAVLMQTVRKHLMKHFGAELMRVGSNITAKELKAYDVTAELAIVIDKIDQIEREDLRTKKMR